MERPFAVVLRCDPIGPCVLILRGSDREPLLVEPGIKYNVVAQTDDDGEAVGVAHLLQRAIRRGEPR